MNNFDKAFNNIMSSTFSSMCLNEYQEPEQDEKDPALAAANDANDDTDVGQAKQKHDRELEKVINQKTKNLQKASSALRRPGSTG
jgi:hypothetical protein